MKKAIMLMTALCSAFVLFSASAKAQDVMGRNFVNVGIGLGSFHLSGTGGLPLSVSVEHGFHDKISAGLYVGFIQRTFATYWKYRYVVVGARGSYHFNELIQIDNPKVDLYGGATLYYRGYKYKYTNGEVDESIKTSGGTVGMALHAGGRYMFADKVGGFAEVGYGISPIQLGLTVHL
jgi:hypothetical protein